MSEAQFQASQSLDSAKPDRTMDVKVSTIKEALFTRDLTKNEAGIHPDAGSTIKIAKPKAKSIAPNPYEQQINSRIKPDAAGILKVTFAAKETYDQADALCQKIPIWTTSA